MRAVLLLAVSAAVLTPAPAPAQPGSAAPADGLAAIAAAAPGCAAERAYCFAIQLHVASTEQGLVVDPAWVAGQLARANRHFAEIDVGFQVAGVKPLPASAAHVATRADRTRLASRRGRRVIDVFVTGRLDDVDEPDKQIRGVAWRHDGRKYIILSATAWDFVLTHELGHFFGLPHSAYDISLMNKRPRIAPAFEQRTFAPEELAAMRPVVRRLVREKVVQNHAR